MLNGKRHRVVVTGIGIVSPIGIGVREFWEAMLAGRIGARAITRFDTDGYPSRIAAEIDHFDPADHMDPKRVRWTDRFAQYAVAAARGAFDDAGISKNGPREDVGIFIGSALGGVAYADEQHDVFRQRGLGSVRPLLAISVFGGSATCNVALEFDVRGPTVANANSCASGAVAIGEAFRAVGRGDVRAAIAGGAEAPLSPLCFGAFTVIGAMSTRNEDPQHASRPFDRERDGFVMAEGAGMLVLERYEDAVARGAHMYGEIRGFGASNDAHHMSAPRPGGDDAARAIQIALEEAHIAPSEIEAVSAHGSSTQLGDRAEAKALRRVFGDGIAQLPITASKGQHGHAFGAAGAWEAALSLLTLRHGVLPRVVGHFVDDPECDLAFVRSNVEGRVRTMLSNTAGFGGINAALVFSALDS
ncbi:MAG: beta-ketoacyl-ACP synthase II [Vulcanimicrobiaceae bacterium]|jgi:3-oxoacyl-[acyl-carrier-protein] synthase II